MKDEVFEINSSTSNFYAKNLKKNKMKKLNTLAVLIFLLGSINVSAQETIHHDDTNTWFTILNRLNLNSKWSVSNEIHERTGAFLREQGTFLLRPSIDYHLNKNVEFSIGYSYINNKPNDPNPNPKIGVIENNMWEQVLLKNDIGKVHFQHRLRQENRWFDTVGQNLDGTYAKTGTVYANRFRYRLTINTDLKKFENNKSLFFQAFDEVWIPQTDKLAPKSLSRNWLYIGLGYKFNPKTNIQIGYMNQWDVIGNNTYISTPILQTTFVRNFDL
jgi:hypothetical protein